MTSNKSIRLETGWEHFQHVADIGVRGFGASVAKAFEQAALALTAVITDPDTVHPMQAVTIFCEAPDIETLLVDWLNAIVFEMSTRSMLFGQFEVTIDGCKLQGRAVGEKIKVSRHQPAAEVKGATFSELKVVQTSGPGWLAQCIVDV